MCPAVIGAEILTVGLASLMVVSLGELHFERELVQVGALQRQSVGSS